RVKQSCGSVRIHRGLLARPVESSLAEIGLGRKWNLIPQAQIDREAPADLEVVLEVKSRVQSQCAVDRRIALPESIGLAQQKIGKRQSGKRAREGIQAVCSGDAISFLD